MPPSFSPPFPQTTMTSGLGRYLKMLPVLHDSPLVLCSQSRHSVEPHIAFQLMSPYPFLHCSSCQCSLKSTPARWGRGDEHQEMKQEGEA